MDGTNRRSLIWGLTAAALALLIVALFVSMFVRQRSRGPEAPGSAAPGRDGAGLPPAPGDAPTEPPGERPALTPSPATSAELHAILGEEAVPVQSDVEIEALEIEQPWVCAGEPVGLAAHVSGGGPEAVQRWIWRTPEGTVALQPGSALAWPTPAAPGVYRVFFQVCTDLGGRRIGVLASRALDVEVRACDEPAAAVRIEVSQRGQGVFAFTAMVADEAARAGIADYVWDFGDGAQLTTTAPSAEHTYAVAELGAEDVAHFAVTVAARRAGEPLTGTTAVLVRGMPGTRDPGPALLALGRWQHDPARNRWTSDIQVQVRERGPIVWERLERFTKYFDDRTESATLDWREVIAVDESLASGGFRGQVLVPDENVPPEVKQIIDVLHGRASDGAEVTVSWTPFKRAPASPGDAGVAPGK
jgi:hypothetical protein